MEQACTIKTLPRICVIVDLLFMIVREPMGNFYLYRDENKVIFNDDDEVLFVLGHHA
jgi:hypothetical protein